jgi:hypothetical protein
LTFFEAVPRVKESKEPGMENVLGCVLMVGITFPVSFLMARTCLRGVIRLVTGPEERHVLSSRP